ncbi:MAG: hypothetical protein ACOYNF_07860 [Rhodoferax sp.]
MPIDYKKNQAKLREIVSVEDAEGLLNWLQNKPSAKIDLAECTHLHPANLQVLMAARCRVTVWPEDAHLRGWLETALPFK